MSRWVAALVFLVAASLCAQSTPPSQPPAGSQDKKPELKRDRTQKTSEKEEVPPEEDTGVAKDDFSFNPLQSQRDVGTGDYYRKKGNLAAAANRYQNATKRNEGNAEAWRKLGEVRQKLKDQEAARVAYTKFLELDPSSKMAQEVRKELNKLK